MSYKKVKVTFCGGAKNPTGSNFLLDNGISQILVDCGLYQGEQIGEEVNRDEFSFNPKEIETLFVTHAHLDHVGRIPKLIHEGFKGKIISTPPTKDMAELVMLDSMRILAKEARKHGKEPLYSTQDVKKALKLWETVKYHEEIKGGKDEWTADFIDAGHILGSAIVTLTYNGTKIAFTGDLGNTPATLMNDTEIPKNITYLVIESVYGDRNHEDKDDRVAILRSVIEENSKKGGVLMIPAFSIERTQDLLFEINDMVEHEDLAPLPIFLDSPLAIKITDIYKKYKSYLNTDAKAHEKEGDDVFDFPLLRFTLKHEESEVIREIENPKIIIAGSGMSNGGRIVRHEKEFLPDKNNTLLLVGYQSVGTRGRLLQDKVKVINIDNEDIPVNAEIVQIHGFSAHKDSDNLLDFVADVGEDEKLKKVFVVLGEPKSELFLVQKIRDYLDIDDTVTPNDREEVELEF